MIETDGGRLFIPETRPNDKTARGTFSIRATSLGGRVPQRALKRAQDFSWVAPARLGASDSVDIFRSGKPDTCLHCDGAAQARTKIAAADFSRIRNADLGRFTVDRLMSIVNRLGLRVDVKVRFRREHAASPAGATWG